MGQEDSETYQHLNEQHCSLSNQHQKHRIPRQHKGRGQQAHRGWPQKSWLPCAWTYRPATKNAGLPEQSSHTPQCSTLEDSKGKGDPTR